MSQETLSRLQEILTNTLYTPKSEQLTPILKSFIQGQVPLSAYMTFISTLKEPLWVEFLSSLLDTYVPSFKHIALRERDEDWFFIRHLSDEERQADHHFFNSLWIANQSKHFPLDSTLSEVVLFSMLKHSGLFQLNMFEFHLLDFQQNFGYLPFELLLTYDDEDTQIFPIPMMYRWIMMAFVFLGTEQTATILTTLSERHEEDYFDLEILWLEHGDFFTECAPLTIGKILLKTQALATTLDLPLSGRDTLSHHMIYPVSNFPDLPEAPKEESDYEDVDDWVLG